jgi:hypothetical protein
MLEWFIAEAARALSLESFQVQSGGGGSQRQKLQSHGPPQPGILGFIDHTHSAATELLLDAVV